MIIFPMACAERIYCRLRVASFTIDDKELSVLSETTIERREMNILTIGTSFSLVPAAER